MGRRREDLLRAAVGLALSLGVIVPAYRLRALTLDGAGAAFVVGGCVFGRGGLRKSVALITFFVTSSALSKLPTNQGAGQPLNDNRRAGRTGGADSRPIRPLSEPNLAARRNLRQVVANGAIPAIAASLAGPATSGRAGSAFGGSLAASTADTWATEVGTRWGGAPRSLGGWGSRPLEPGESGGVTLIGSLGGAVGAGLIAGLVGDPSRSRRLALALAGTGGMLVDSLLGATAQGRFWCAVCDAPTESRRHECGHATSLVRGLGWLDNDAVNLLGSAAGALLAIVLTGVLGRGLRGQNGRLRGTIE